MVKLYWNWIKIGVLCTHLLAQVSLWSLRHFIELNLAWPNDQVQRGLVTLKLRKAPIPIMHPILSQTVRKGGKTRHVEMGKDKLTTSSVLPELLHHFLEPCF